MTITPDMPTPEMSSKISVKRIYAAKEPDDHKRVLVDRLWPRGIKKDADVIDEWLPEVAPSAELRKWYNHDPERFEEFRDRYQTELTANPQQQAAVRHLLDLAEHGTLTLVYAARDEVHNQAVILRDYLLHERSTLDGR